MRTGIDEPHSGQGNSFPSSFPAGAFGWANVMLTWSDSCSSAMVGILPIPAIQEQEQGPKSLNFLYVQTAHFGCMCLQGRVARRGSASDHEYFFLGRHAAFSGRFAGALQRSIRRCLFAEEHRPPGRAFWSLRPSPRPVLLGSLASLHSACDFLLALCAPAVKKRA